MKEVVGWMRECGVVDTGDGSARGQDQYVRVVRTLVRALSEVDREWLQARDESGAADDSGLMAEMRSIGQPIDGTFPATLIAVQQLLHTQLGQLPTDTFHTYLFRNTR